MTKQLEKTPQLVAALKASIDDESFDVNNVAIFQAKLCSTEPISKNGIYNKARFTRGTLTDMAEYVNTKGTNVPLQAMHDSQVLPFGRLFSAEVSTVDDVDMLLGNFYIAQTDPEKLKLIADIESSTIDEVSVSVMPKKVLCSECGFDYLGEDADFFNIIMYTCGEDHVVGENGVHVNVSGMESFTELSLVGRGAARNAKILSRAKQSGSLNEQTAGRLAASGIPMGAQLITAECKLGGFEASTNNNDGEDDMNELQVMLANSSKELGKTTAELDVATKTIESLNAELSEKDTTIEAHVAKIAELSADDVKAELTAFKDETEVKLSEASAVISEHYKASQVALGKEVEDDIKLDLFEMIDAIKDAGVKLHQTFKSEGTAQSSNSDVDATGVVAAKEDVRTRNFKLNK